MSVVGTQTYARLRLIAPEKPKDRTFEQLTAVLLAHFTPQPSEIVESFRFHGRPQREREPVGVFVAELRKLAENCNFRSALNRMLRDRLVRGIRNKRIQQ